MKPVINFGVCIVSILLISIPSCKKEKSNRRPTAQAGDNVEVQLSSCSDRTGSAELDGSGSFDPDSNIISYSWKYIYGPDGFTLNNADSPIAKLETVSFGQYTFELTVADQEGLVAKDVVNVITKLEEHDLDITLSGDVRFVDNYHYTDFNYDYYIDSAEIKGRGNSPPFGKFYVSILEESDSADLADSHNTRFYIYTYPLSNKYIFGDCSINFKKLIKNGGGPFAGTLQQTSGSANLCGVVLTSLLPLTMTGNLDIASNIITLAIQGKAVL